MSGGVQKALIPPAGLRMRKVDQRIDRMALVDMKDSTHLSGAADSSPFTNQRRSTQEIRLN